MEEIDWDSYFERRSLVRYEWWKRWYKNRLSEARDFEAAQHLFSLWSHTLDFITIPEDHFAQAIVNRELIYKAHEITSDYYEKLYISFKVTWQLYKNNPVVTFLKNTAPEIVRMYRLQMIDKTSWDKQLKAQNEADTYVKSNAGIKEIVNRLAFCAARERIKAELVPIESLDLNSLTAKPLKFEEDDSKFQKQPVTRGRKTKNLLPDIPKTEIAFRTRYNLGKAVQDFVPQSKGMPHKDIMQEVATSKNVNLKTVERGYNLKKYIDRNCPINIKTNLKEIHNWLIRLENNEL